MFGLLFTSPFVFVVFALSLVISITVHEFAHAFLADRLGDPTARVAGRLTLNPLAHLDPLGTLALLFIGFGWGKPVMFDPYNLRNPRRDAAIISLAGPASNLLLAVLLSLVLRLFGSSLILENLFSLLIQLNVTLAVFNLVPVYPLDGEKILVGFLSPALAREYSLLMQRYGVLILLFLLLPFSGASAISALISPLISFFTRLLL